MEEAGIACPSCGAPMLGPAFARRPEGHVALDLCFACQGIWFDAYESVQLASRGVIELFRVVHHHSVAVASPIADRAHCPACRRTLRLTHDLQGTNHFTYLRCPEAHGRFITFFHFLREKQFIRSLSNAEIERLKATVRQVRCSSCGAPVSVERDAACSYCRAPLAILNADAMQRTLAELDAADRRAPRPPDIAAAAFEAVLEGRRVERRLARDEAPGSIDLVRETLSLFTALV